MPSNTPVSVLRDSGSSLCVVKSVLVKPEQYTGEYKKVEMIDGTIKEFPVAIVEIDSPYLSRQVEALSMPNCLCEVVIGNVSGARDANDPDLTWVPKVSTFSKFVDPGLSTDQSPLNGRCPQNRPPEADFGEPEGDLGEPEGRLKDSSREKGLMVETRAQTEKKGRPVKPLKVLKSIPEVSPEEFRSCQKADQSLKPLWDKARAPDDGKSKYIFIVRHDLLYRKARYETEKYPTVLVVPVNYRLAVMQIAHESAFSGHFGINNTLKKVQTQFFWPGMVDEVNRFCRSCDVCQKTIDKGRVPKVPLGKMPIMDTPFQRITLDLVGLHPPTERGHMYILTIIDYATRYCEALPLKTITTVEVAEALLQVYSRVGVPLEVQSDLGTQFVSDLMKEVSRLLSIKGVTSTRYHPISNGLVERYNGLIKRILRKMCTEQPKQWDRYLPALMFSLREIPSSSLGYSPFELLYGRNVRGPMEILHELWSNETLNNERKSEYQYVIDLHERLVKTWDLAKLSLNEMAQKYKRYYDQKAKPRKLKVGDKVLVLLPSSSNKLLLKWKGPYPVVQVKYENDYVIDMDGSQKLFHINLLKKYFDRAEENLASVNSFCLGETVNLAGLFDVVDHIGGCDDSLDDLVEESEVSDLYQEGDIVSMPSVEQSEFIKHVKIDPGLSRAQIEEVQELLCNYQDIFTDIPKKTSAFECKINLTTDQPIRSRPYQVPQAMREVLHNEVQNMLKLGVIEKSIHHMVILW